MQCKRAATTEIASKRVCAKILELVLRRSTTAKSVDARDMLTRSHVNLLLGAQPEYWTLGVHQRRDKIRTKGKGGNRSGTDEGVGVGFVLTRKQSSDHEMQLDAFSTEEQK